jgi:hypothetical protein
MVVCKVSTVACKHTIASVNRSIFTDIYCFRQPNHPYNTQHNPKNKTNKQKHHQIIK